MGFRSIITNAGLELLANASAVSGQYYWLGYYALAYVPNIWKEDPIVLPGNNFGRVNTDNADAKFIDGHEILSTESEKLTTTMTKLTENGDMIWNIFQGDLIGTGYLDGLSDGSTGGDLFGLTMYNANIKKHYRYVLDDNGNNTLVTWKNETSTVMAGALIYYGTDGYFTSTLPIPAPLYYFGDASKDNTVANPPFSITQYLNDYLSNTGSDLYPSIPITISPGNGGGTYDIPAVSVDFREYNDSIGDNDNSPTTPGTYFDTNEISAANGDFEDVNSWYDSNSTTYGDTKVYLDEFWSLISVSNYNRYHAPVGSDGNILNSELKNRNLSKVTKFFPIANYSVINSQRGFASTGEAREVATGLTLTIDVNLTPRLKSMGYDEFGNYSKSSDMTLQDRYNNLSNTNELFNETKTSFKFNRIGIYAVPIRKAPNVQASGITLGKSIDFEVEVNPDDEPVLFAVVDWDNTVIMSDAGDALARFTSEIAVNLESPDGVNATGLIRDTAIFYNLYKEDSVTWFKNQLIANASTQHALTEMAIQLGTMKNKSLTNNTTACCSGNSSVESSSDGLINLLDASTSADGGLKGINTYPEGTELNSVVYEMGESSVALGDNTAAAANNSFVVGVNNYIIAPTSANDARYSAIVGGFSNLITDVSSSCIITGSDSSSIQGTSYNSSIISSFEGSINGSSRSGILGSYESEITHADGTHIVGGDSNKITGFDEDNLAINSIILGGENGLIESEADTEGSIKNNSILGGEGNKITGNVSGDNNAIIGGYLNHSQNNSHSVILGGREAIFQSSQDSVIIGGNSNYIDSGITSFAMGGYSNVLSAATGSGIMSALTSFLGSSTYSNIIGSESGELNNVNRTNLVGGISNGINNSVNSGIFGGNANYISGNGINFLVQNSVILGGKSNNIIINEEYSTDNNSVVGGNSNYIISNVTDVHHNSIIGGDANAITDSNACGIISSNGSQITPGGGDMPFRSIVMGGYINNIFGSDDSIILGGELHTLTVSDRSTILGGSKNTILNCDNAATVGGSELNATHDYQVVMGKNNDVNVGGAPSLLIGDGVLGGAASNAFYVTKLPSGAITLYIKSLPTISDPNLTSGMLYKSDDTVFILP